MVPSARGRETTRRRAVLVVEQLLYAQMPDNVGGAIQRPGCGYALANAGHDTEVDWNAST